MKIQLVGGDHRTELMGIAGHVEKTNPAWTAQQLKIIREQLNDMPVDDAREYLRACGVDEDAIAREEWRKW